MTSRRMNKNSRKRHESRRLRVRGLRRNPPDISKISKALIALAMAEAEREAQAEQDDRGPESTVTSSGQSPDGGVHHA